jgi:hypothetical protein
MSEAERLVHRAAEDARSGTDGVRNPYEDMVWENDMLVPRQSSLDKETLDERSARGMGERWEERRRDE